MKYKKLLRFERRWLMNPNFSGFSKLTGWVVQRFPSWLRPNHLTLSGLFLCIPMTWMYWINEYVTGTTLLVIGLLTDAFDGPLARHRQGSRPLLTLEEERALGWWGRINYDGVTFLGKFLDPITDKVRFFCALYALGWGVVSRMLVITLTVMALLLTFVRPVKRWLGLGDGTSNLFGKLKIWAEFVALLPLTLYPENRIVLNSLFGIALLFATLSLSGHIFGAKLALMRQKRAERAQARMERKAARKKSLASPS